MKIERNMPKFKWKKNLVRDAFIGGGVLGLLLFFAIYGYHVLDFQNVAYILNDGLDMPGTYIAWQFYRYSDWSEGIGLFNTLTYPNATSVIYIDAVPLLSFFFKLLSPLLPEIFQYTGLWALICFVLQGGLASVIINKFSKNTVISILCSIPFILAQPMLLKLFYHHAEGGQWIILLTFCIWFYSIEKTEIGRKDYLMWFGMGALTSAICTYFVPMVGMILVGYSINKFLQNHKMLRQSIFLILFYLFGVIMVFWFFGGFNTDFLQSDAYLSEYVDRLYRCGANLDAFFNSWGDTYFTKGYNVARDGQGEGQAYLGVGILVALVTAVSITVASKLGKYKDGQNKKTVDFLFISLLIVFVLSFIVSLGPTVSFHSRILFEIPYPQFIIDLWSTFRSTGRFIWPAFYLIIIYVFKVLFQYIRDKKFLYIFLIFCVCLQVVDFLPILINKHKTYAYVQEYETSLIDEGWNILGEKYKHLVVLPNSILNRSQDRYIIAKYANDYKMTLNDFYLARQSLMDQTNYNIDLISKGKAEDDTIYMISYDLLELFISLPLHFYLIDDYVIGVKEDISLLLNKNEISKEDYLIWMEDAEGEYIYDNIDYSLIFDPYYYRYRYYSLNQVNSGSIIDKNEILANFVEEGIEKGRQAKPNFDVIQYKEKNADLSETFGSDLKKYYMHYLKTGKDEGRITSYLY